MHLIAHNRFSSAFRFILAHLKAGGYATDSTKRQSPCSQVLHSSQTQTSQPSLPQVLLAAWNLRFNNSNDSLSLCIRGTAVPRMHNPHKGSAEHRRWHIRPPAPQDKASELVRRARQPCLVPEANRTELLSTYRTLKRFSSTKS